ncbi:hypothetical protein [Bradyrhizobium sp. CB1015]|uniref:hypothetical protein n=1 Tax=Bradyrhizobium sp. CB1015 TaxID=2976822 RepID=UPI0021A9FE97|nr:hypothetical protein [Bradyrhizobium sp. CB1015]UWU95837.1 hypothetical protein N2604_18980 [Bradyrhizobium sp. CB1015]
MSRPRVKQGSFTVGNFLVNRKMDNPQQLPLKLAAPTMAIEEMFRDRHARSSSRSL